MAAVPAVIHSVTAVRGPDPTQAGDAAAINIRTFDILCDNGSTQVAGGTDTLDINVATVIPAWFRNGCTYTLRAHMMTQAARTTGSTEYAGTTATSSNTVQLTPKLASDYTTNATIAASALAGGVPYIVTVCVTESVS